MNLGKKRTGKASPCFAMRKKGDENWFVVSLILVVLTIVVIIGVFVSFNWKQDIDRAACHESAVVKGTIPEGAKSITSLTCKTRRICVTSKIIGSDCDSGLGNNYVTMRISGTKDQKETQVKMILAREMADCWNTLGEGNLKIFNSEITANKQNSFAVICSRVMFGNSVTVDDEIKSVSEMSNYLLSHKVPGKEISYWDYFRNTPDGDTLQIVSGFPVKEDIMDLTKQKAIFYLETSTSKEGAVAGGVIGALGTTAILGALGGAGFKGVGVVGSILGIGSTAAQAVVLGTGTYYGATEGQKLFDYLVNKEFNGQSYVSGVFLTDYSQEGFDGFENKNLKFENIP